MYHILTYTYTPSYLEDRAPFRALHFDHIQPYIASESMILGGATADPADRGILIFRGLSRKQVEDFAMNDPYVQHGIATSFHIQEWTVVAGSAHLA